MLFINSDVILQQEFNDNVEYISKEEKEEVLEKLNNIKTKEYDSIDDSLKIAIEILTSDEVSQDIFFNYTEEEFNEILEKTELLLQDSLIDGNVNIDSKLYACKTISKICSVLETSASKKVKDIPTSALFF